MKSEENVNPENESEKSASDKWKSLLANILWIAGILLAVIFIVEFVGQRTKVDGRSMEPMLQDGDQLIVDKISYRFRDPERFDIIIFPYHGDGSKKVYYIKRIIGLPGETVQIVDGKIYIDGEVLEEDYGKEVMEEAGRASQPIVLGDDEYFVLGDNRNNSKDSRVESVGNIKRSDIIGRAWVRIFPFDTFGVLKHK
ncbi:MAG: signal peptidase I [Eubacteriales bacterium]|nr:signal peptidase I [Eubacteriales bacterium]